MSIELSVPLGQTNLRQDISPSEVARALASILGASEFPGVEIEILVKDQPRSNASLRMHFQGMEADGVVITEAELGVAPPQITPDEANRWAMGAWLRSFVEREVDGPFAETARSLLAGYPADNVIP